MYVGPAVSGVLHLGLLALALAPARPEPIISPDAGPPVEVSLMSEAEYNEAVSQGGTAPPPPNTELAMALPQTPETSSGSQPQGVTLTAPPVETQPVTAPPATPPNSANADTDAPDLALNEGALQDRPVEKSELVPEDRIRVVTAPEAPQQPRGVIDAPEVDKNPDEPPKEEVEPTAEAAPSTDVAQAEIPQRNGAPPLTAPLPRPKPRGSLAAETTDEDIKASPVADAGDGPLQRNVEEEEARSAEVAREILEQARKTEERVKAEAAKVAAEKLAAEALEEKRLRDEDARIAAEDAAAEKRAAEEALAKAEAAEAAKELAEREAAEEEKERQADAERAAEAEEEKRLAEQDARREAEEAAKELAEAELEKQRAAEEEAKRLAEAELEKQRAAEEEAKRIAEAELEKQRAAEEEAKRLAEAELAKQRAADEAAARQKAEQELAAKRAYEAEQAKLAADQQRMREEMEAIKRAKEEEAARLAQAADEERRRQAYLDQVARERQRAAEEQARQQAYEAEQYALRQQQLQQYNAQSQIGQQTDRNLSVGTGNPSPAPQGDQFMAMLGNAVGSQSPNTRGTPSFSDNVAARNNAAPLSPGEQQGLLDQLSRCWRMMGQNVEVVTIRVALSQDGRVVNATPLNGSGLALETANRALRDPACQPFRLPPQKYGSWQQLDIVFDPRRMSVQ